MVTWFLGLVNFLLWWGFFIGTFVCLTYVMVTGYWKGDEAPERILDDLPH